MTTRPLRVSFIAGTLGNGGAERQLFYMSSSLLQTGTQCQVLSLDQNQFYHTRLAEIGVPVVYVGQYKSRLRRLLRIVQEVQQWNPDIIQSSHLYTNLYAAFAAWMTSSYSIGANRSDVYHEVQSLRYLGKLSLKCPGAIISNSEHAIQTMQDKKLRHRNIFLLENAVDCEYFRPSPRSKPHTAQIQVVAVGRLVTLKRYDVLLSAIAIVRRTIPNIKVRIVGDGPQRANLESLATELAVHDIVDFVGEQYDMSPIYQGGDIFVLTSDYEGTPNVVLEAMACGLPVIATRAGAMAKLIDNGRTGFVTDIGDVDAIATSITELASHPDQRVQMGYSARAKIEAQFSSETYASRLYAIYYQVLKNRGGKNPSESLRFP
ncbi:MAG: glycosyltransferase [Anaerolineae bacterium]|nr:glycosyltransferase [Anaerolineae bacterium]